MNRSVLTLVIVGLSLAGCASFDQDMVNWRDETHSCNQFGIGVTGARLSKTTNQRCVSSLQQLGYLKAELRGSTGVVVGAIGSSQAQARPIVESVTENSPAARAGMKPGDLVQKIDGNPVYDVTQANRSLFGVIGSLVTVEVRRDYVTTVYSLQRESADFVEAPLASVKKTDSINHPY